ncbi:MAG TPA: hypothetical protein VK993_11885 [Chthoniobacterales bacterium]|nr:hypothetical protein [Chthoniobacterales bacterium]
MPSPPFRQIALIVALGFMATILAFQTGRWSVGVISSRECVAAKRAAVSQPVEARRAPATDQAPQHTTMRNMAMVPFTQLYDILRSASQEQLGAWAQDLERMPRGPKQRAAVAAFFKSLVQVDHRAAIEAVLHAQNLVARDVAIEAMMKAAPESIWADLAEMTAQLAYPGRGYRQDDLIKNWSRVDPVAASQFVEKHRFSAGVKLRGEEFDRVVSLMSNWGEIDPAAARNWLEADASRQTADAFRALVTSWGRVDRSGAIDYAVANADHPQFDEAIKELVYEFVRSAKEDASRLLLLLPPRQAEAAVKNVADIINPREIDPNLDRPPDYQRPPGEVARWMVSLPVELWRENIGVVAQEWLSLDPVSATAWFDQLDPNIRETAILSLCNARQSSPREEVLKLAWTIRDPRLREKALGRVARSLRPDWEDAIEAINDLPFSDEQKAYLRKVIPEGAGDGG